MATKPPRPLSDLNFLVPGKYVEVDMTKAIKPEAERWDMTAEDAELAKAIIELTGDSTAQIATRRPSPEGFNYGGMTVAVSWAQGGQPYGAIIEFTRNELEDTGPHHITRRILAEVSKVVGKPA